MKKNKMDSNKENKECSTPQTKEENKPKKSLEFRKDSEHSIDESGKVKTVGKEIKGGDASPVSASPKIPRKFINNWKQACDKTKDKTKELLKKWRTLPEQGQLEQEYSGASISDEGGGSSSGWSEHVWMVSVPATWVKRFPSGEEQEASGPILLTEVQRGKFASFFTNLLDMDRDDVISLADFEGFSERLRHFADWSKNSPEYHRLREVQRGFVHTFLTPKTMETPVHSYEMLEKLLMKEQISLEDWLRKWGELVDTARSFQDLPLWLQYFPKILFVVINKSGSGIITEDELKEFYASILGLSSHEVQKFIKEAYKVFTSNGDHMLSYSVYRLCFANFVLAKFPNGPGQYLLGPVPVIRDTCFPIDYKALSCAPEDLEQYSPELKSNRRSVVV